MPPTTEVLLSQKKTPCHPKWWFACGCNACKEAALVAEYSHIDKLLVTSSADHIIRDAESRESLRCRFGDNIISDSGVRTNEMTPVEFCVFSTHVYAEMISIRKTKTTQKDILAVGHRMFLSPIYEDNERAIDWLRRSLETGNNDASFLLAQCYAAGRGVNKSLTKCRHLLIGAATNGHTLSMYVMGLSFVPTGYGGPVDGQLFFERDDPKLAAKWMKMGMNECRYCMYGLGMLAILSDDTRCGYKWLKKSADKKHAGAAYAMASILFDADKLGVLIVTASKYAKIAYHSGHEDAADLHKNISYQLEKELLEAEECEKDTQRARLKTSKKKKKKKKARTTALGQRALMDSESGDAADIDQPGNASGIDQARQLPLRCSDAKTPKTICLYCAETFVTRQCCTHCEHVRECEACHIALSRQFGTEIYGCMCIYAQ